MKDIKGYEGLYAVTSCGKVWSYRRKIFLKPSISKDGYQRVGLSGNGKYRMIEIHRLVAEAYIPNPEGKKEVNHKDEIKSHNYVNNLEWLTHKENINYGTRTERALKNGAFKNRLGNRGRTAIPVYCFELDKVFASATSAEKELGIAQSSICRCCKGKQKTAGKYHWKYATTE